MTRPSRFRGAAALVAACVLGVLGAGSLFAGSALADGSSTPPPVSVTIPGNGTTSTPTPTPTPTPSPSSSSGSSSGGSSSGGSGGGGGGSVATPPHVPGSAPSIPKHPVVATIQAFIEPPVLFAAGDWMTVSAAGFDPGEKVQVVVYYKRGKPVKIGDYVANASGLFAAAFVLPQLDAGEDTVQLTGWDSSKVATDSFLLGASFVAPQPFFQRPAWLILGVLAGLGALAALIWFAVVSLRRPQAVEVGV